MKYRDKYAELILSAGVALQPGQNLLIQTEPVHADFAYELEKLAYRKGARLVAVELVSPKSRLNRANYSKEEYLEYVPPYAGHKLKSYVDEGWAVIYIGGREDRQALHDLNLKRNAVLQRKAKTISEAFIAARMDGTCPWCVCNLPTADWARSIWPETVGDDEVLTNKLWEDMIPILRLDREDPIDAWREQSANINVRKVLLNEAGVNYLHFHGGGTDLKVYLTPYSKFVGAGCLGKLGQEFFPNLPTEEFFTTPDYRRTEGRAVITRPVDVLGESVEGAWFEFSEGAVTDYGADSNKDRLEAFFDTDPKARYLGEVALVDCNSPIYRSGLVFNDILFDENAACHIALGRGYSETMSEHAGKSAEELDELGCNDSLLHTDFMIGSETLDVTAHLKSGGTLEIIRKGYFVI